MIDNYCCCSLLRDCCPSPLSLMQNYKVIWNTHALSWKVPRWWDSQLKPIGWMESWVNQIYFSKKKSALRKFIFPLWLPWCPLPDSSLRSPIFCIALLGICSSSHLAPQGLPHLPLIALASVASVVLVFLQLGSTFPRREGSSPKGQLLHSIT